MGEDIRQDHGARQRAPAGTVLVVDDEPTVLVQMTALLRDEFRVRAARDGAEALRAAAGDPRPDLILLDVMMPGLDGFEVLVRLRADPATREIPVIMVTGLEAEADEGAARLLGDAEAAHVHGLKARLLRRCAEELREAVKHQFPTT